MSHTDALQAVATGQLTRREGFAEVPIAFFVDRIDVNMEPLPEMALFIRENASFTQLVAAGQPFSKLAVSVHESLWIREDDLAGLGRYAEKALLAPGQGAEATSETKLVALRATAMNVCDDLFQNPSPENIQRSQKVVSSFVYVIMKDPKSYSVLSALSSHDPYTLRHSVGTSVNCIIVGKKMGITDPRELEELGVAGLLHDVGKVKVKCEIINKNGPLDELEWEEMRGHAEAGWEILKNNPDLSERVKNAVYEHHEDKQGKGYPRGLKIDQIDIFSRIVGACDVYNALTTDRTYSKARTPFDAFQLMREKLFHKIDDEVFKALVLVYGGKL
jgi:HD-GYP domain-containing protein (c-di-GMP phosphodiesterase class II)